MASAVDLIDELVNSGGEVSLPGLDLESVASHFVDVKYGDTLSSVKDEEERERLRKQWVAYYTEGEGAEQMKLEIATIKSNYSTATESLSEVTEAVTQQLAMAAVPAVITVGSASSTANPAYTVLDNAAKAGNLNATLNSVSASLVDALRSCAAIEYDVPDALSGLVDALKAARTTVGQLG